MEQPIFSAIRIHNGNVFGVTLVPQKNESWIDIVFRADDVLSTMGIPEEVDHAHGVSVFDDGSEEIVHIEFTENYEILGNSMLLDNIQPDDFKEISFDIWHDRQ